jgi:hypothetical protein
MLIAKAAECQQFAGRGGRVVLGRGDLGLAIAEYSREPQVLGEIVKRAFTANADDFNQPVVFANFKERR